MRNIIIKGAKENNLQNIDLSIPRGKVVCFVGVSGSGKSTLAFDIIAREGQRQYFESLPSFARRLLQKSNRPDVAEIQGISSSILIGQERINGSPRSTVGTISEAYTYLRMLYSRAGTPSMDSSYFSFNHPNGACPTCKGLGQAITFDPNKLIDSSKTLNTGALLHSEWRVGGRMWRIIKATNFFDMDKKLEDFEPDELDKLLYAPKQYWSDPDDFVGDKVTYQGIVERLRSPRRHDSERMEYRQLEECPECDGWRLNSKTLSVKLNNMNIGEVGNLSLVDCLKFVETIDLPQAVVIRPRLTEQLQALVDAGVGYLSLNRSADTLSGGEAQRVKIARQMGSDLIETIYVLDEPTAGLHPKDVERVIRNLSKLRDNGNTVLVVEHDESIIKVADYIVEVGPGGGKQGGTIVAQGSLADILASPQSVTAPYLRSNTTRMDAARRKPKGSICIADAHTHNLKSLNVTIPTGVLVALTGVSGSGKSSLVDELLAQHTAKIVLIDQSAIGNNKRGCIGTYTGVFNTVRKIFAKELGMSESFFSYNAHGACEECKGIGHLDMEMNFLGNVQIHCETCDGTRYKPKVLQYRYHGKNIAEVLAMTAVDVRDFFDNEDVKTKTNLLVEVGLDYLAIGQTLDTLSGGEAQRLKLASRLQSKGEFYVLDEPTSGLHFADIKKLLQLLNRLVNNGNTVLVIEHNMTIISQADWIIDLGPEGGDEGGYVVAEGTPEHVALCTESHTGRYLTRNI